jgi:hypothetical protein
MSIHGRMTFYEHCKRFVSWILTHFLPWSLTYFPQQIVFILHPWSVVWDTWNNQYEQSYYEQDSFKNQRSTQMVGPLVRRGKHPLPPVLCYSVLYQWLEKPGHMDARAWSTRSQDPAAGGYIAKEIKIQNPTRSRVSDLFINNICTSPLPGRFAASAATSPSIADCSQEYSLESFEGDRQRL